MSVDRYHGSAPPFYGVLAQLGEQLLCTQKVAGSRPAYSTIFAVICLWDSSLVERHQPFKLDKDGFKSLGSHHCFNSGLALKVSALHC